MTLRRFNFRTPLTSCLLTIFLLSLCLPANAKEPQGELAKKLAGVKFEQYATAPGYSEGPTWLKGEVLFCSGGLLRVDADKKTHNFLDIGPAGTVLMADGHLLICDNKHAALLDFSPDGKLGVVAEKVDGYALNSLNDLTIDAQGNIYWTDPSGSSLEKPVGNILRLQTDGRVDKIGTGLAFPNGIEVDPASKFLYVIESQSKKILRYALPEANKPLGPAEVFYDLAGSGGDGCAFDAEGNLWVADFHRPETMTGRITVLSPEAKVLAYLPIPSKVVSNIAFGGPNHDEIFCTTGDPPGVFRAAVGVKGFAGHPGKPAKIVRYLDVVPQRPHADAEGLRKLVELAAKAELKDGKFSAATQQELKSLIAALSDPQIKQDATALLPGLEQAAARYQADQPLLKEVARLHGKAISTVFAPAWLRAITGDAALAVFGRITELDLNERTDGHKEAEKKLAEDRVTNDWLKRLAGQTDLQRLELSGTAVTSEGLVHLKDLTNIDRLNICLTACDDRGFEHLAGMTKMKRMTICASQITGSGFAHLGSMKELESINLHSAPASDEGLAAISKLTSLLRLEVVHTHITDAGLAHLGSLVNLRQLHIHGKETTEKGLPFISQLKELYELDVYDHAASDATLQQIAQLPKLRKLMLPIGVFTDAGVAYLAKVKTLEEVTLDSPNITDASIEPLAELKNLRKLHFGQNKLTPEGRARLAKLLPNTVITP